MMSRLNYLRYLSVWEAAIQRCSVKKVFLEISQNSQENTCARVSFLIKWQASDLQLYLKRDSDTCFPVNFVILLRTPFCTEHFWWLLLQFDMFVLWFAFEILLRSLHKLSLLWMKMFFYSETLGILTLLESARRRKENIFLQNQKASKGLGFESVLLKCHKFWTNVTF